MSQIFSAIEALKVMSEGETVISGYDIYFKMENNVLKFSENKDKRFEKSNLRLNEFLEGEYSKYYFKV